MPTILFTTLGVVSFHNGKHFNDEMPMFKKKYICIVAYVLAGLGAALFPSLANRCPSVRGMSFGPFQRH